MKCMSETWQRPDPSPDSGRTTLEIKEIHPSANIGEGMYVQFRV